ncbi:MAG: hypothetical protein KDE09_23270, partial [Anaerolineales bacterium]|nr:hypothetical protein [Anaerolineales bacterium]
PMYGPLAAVLVAAVAEITPWIISMRKNPSEWRRAFERLGFNMGMNAIAAFLSGWVFVFLQLTVGADSVWAEYVPWLPAAFVGDQANMLMLMGILYLANGVAPAESWREHRWAIPINLLVTGVGGAMLAIAIDQFQFLGVAIFFMPIILSAYAFRLFVDRTKEQMDKLEDLIAVRTGELAAANDSLKDLNAEKDAFLAVLTHDMRSPLTSIHGFARMLRDRPELPPDKRVYMADIILRSERTLLEIVNNILDIEKLQSGAPIVLDRENVDLTQVVGEIAEVSEGQALEKEIVLSFNRPDDPIFIQLDPQKIKRVLQNVISNAIKYTPDEGQVDVAVQRNGQYAYVVVRDTGYGIPANELPYIFNRYRRVEGHKGRAVGTGLGLAIVKSLVEAHEGEITVESEVNVGSTFTLKLPL